MTSPSSLASLTESVAAAINAAISGASASVTEVRSGHFEIFVAAAPFEGQTPLTKQRAVLSAIKPFMSGDHAPVHAIDKIHFR